VVPILARDEFLGVVFANWAPGERLPSRGPLFRGMAGLADQAALALSNVRLIERTRHQATHDALTGLANRVLFHEHLAAALERTRRTGETTAVCYLDLDGFKEVNDTYGHEVGDRVLVAVADRLRAAVRGVDEVARLAGDEFGVLLREIRRSRRRRRGGREAGGRAGRPARRGRPRGPPRASVGVALAPAHGDTPDALLREADVAMYEAKAHGSTYRIRAAVGSA
jgi:diguanylate cyclase (GGDEF)-like protein